MHKCIVLSSMCSSQAACCMVAGRCLGQAVCTLWVDQQLPSQPLNACSSHSSMHKAQINAQSMHMAC